MKKHPDIRSFVKENPEMYPDDVSRETGYSASHITKIRRELGLPRLSARYKTSPTEHLPVEEQVKHDLKETKLKEDKKTTDKKYRILQKEVEQLETELEAFKDTREVTVTKIPVSKKKRSAATAVVLASDWHYEEEVLSGTCSGMNEFNLPVADARIETFWQNLLKLIQSKQAVIDVDTLVLALLGDFINNTIHEEMAETNLLQPADALCAVQEKLASGIQFMLDNTNLKLVIPCHSGNHGRMTSKQRIANEKGNSLEYVIYYNLAHHFSGNKRVSFELADGYFSYIDIGGFIIRFHHGHQLRFNGGVGGLFIPVRKSINQWNKARHADLDCFGHFHQFKWGGDFICNGSLVGYNAYAQSIKADYELPTQAFFLVNHNRHQITDISPVWLD